MAQVSEAQMERARKLAATAHSWPKGTARRGGFPVWLVPSQSREGLFHQATRCQCDCPAWTNGRMCVHVLSVRIVTAKQCPGYEAKVRYWTSGFNASESVAVLEARERQQRQTARYEQIWGEAA